MMLTCACLCAHVGRVEARLAKERELAAEAVKGTRSSGVVEEEVRDADLVYPFHKSYKGYVGHAGGPLCLLCAADTGLPGSTEVRSGERRSQAKRIDADDYVGPQLR
jgi:hypothetical protein